MRVEKLRPAGVFFGFDVHFFLNRDWLAVALRALPPVRSRSTTKPQPGLSPVRSQAFESECVGFFADAVQLFGVPKSVGQIYGLLYATPAPLTLADIVERLEISKGSASQGLQLLRSLGAIHEASANPSVDISNPENARASRGIAYVPELGLRKLIGGVLREQVAPLAASSEAQLTRLHMAVDTSPAELKGFYSKRVDKLSTWRRRLKTVMPVLSSLLGAK